MAGSRGGECSEKNHGSGGDIGEGSSKTASPVGDWLEGAGDVMPRGTVGAIRMQDLVTAVACHQTCSRNQKESLQDQLEPHQQDLILISQKFPVASEGM
ncbi:UNVERIFIED_CONTAM: hypothetical protein K2H54_061918 [Gekko kuhli]